MERFRRYRAQLRRWERAGTVLEEAIRKTRAKFRVQHSEASYDTGPTLDDSRLRHCSWCLAKLVAGTGCAR